MGSQFETVTWRVKPTLFFDEPRTAPHCAPNSGAVALVSSNSAKSVRCPPAAVFFPFAPVVLDVVVPVFGVVSVFAVLLLVVDDVVLPRVVVPCLVVVPAVPWAVVVAAVRCVGVVTVPA